MSRPPRVWISNRTPAKGETVQVRTMITHPMDAGLRMDPDGQPLPRNIVNHFQCLLGDTRLFEWFPETAISQNPYLEFRFRADAPGPLRLIWTDDTGQITELSERFSPI